MRKNIYKDDIIMFSYYELYDLACTRVISDSEQRILMDCLRNSFPDETFPKQEEENIGIKKDNEIINIAKKVFEWRDGNKHISLESLRNAYLFSVMNDEEKETLTDAFKHCSTDTTISEFISTYGEDLYDYIMIHKNYSYIENVDPVYINDISIFLYEDGVSKEIETSKEKKYKKIIRNNYR